MARREKGYWITWYATHREQRRAESKAYYKKNRVAMLKKYKLKMRNLEHRLKLRNRVKERYKIHKKEINKRSMDWQRKYPEKVKLNALLFRIERKGHLSREQKKYYKKYRNEYFLKMKNWIINHPDKVKKWRLELAGEMKKRRERKMDSEGYKDILRAKQRKYYRDNIKYFREKNRIYREAHKYD